MVERVVQARLRSDPAVALVGPRQSGKTTLARTLTSTYFDLEQESDRLRLDLQWDDVFHGSELVVLDEAQAWPEVFPRLRGTIDAQRSRKGRVLLLGSISPSLMHQVSESLAGRLALVELTPLLLIELERPNESLQDPWVFGGYPDGGILDESRFPQWQSDYLTLLAQRDLPNWGLPAKPQVTERLLKMLAAVHSQIWNASKIGQSLGLSHSTINSYLDYLEGAFLIRRLPAYQTNIKKRLVKSPKCYWRDSGLLHSLLRVHRETDLWSEPWIGASWEGFVIEQILGTLYSMDHRIDSYFFRSSDGYEIDLLLVGTKDVWAIEIKLTTAPGPEDFARLKKTAAMVGATKRILVSQTKSPIVTENDRSASLPWLLQEFTRGNVPS